MAQPYASALIESLRGAGIPGATLGGEIMYLDYPWMRNTIAALRNRPVKSYLANPETLVMPDAPATTAAAAPGGGSAAFLGGTPNPNTIGETIPEKKSVEEAPTETGTAAVPKGTPLEMAEEKTGVISVEELPPPDDGELSDLNKKGVITVEELPPADDGELIDELQKKGVITVEELIENPPPAAGTPAELVEEPEPEGVVTVEELPADPPPAQTVRSVLEEIVPPDEEEEEPEPQGVVTVEELPAAPPPQSVAAPPPAAAAEPEPEPEVAVTVEEIVEPPPAPPPPPPTVREVITEMLQASQPEPAPQPEPEVSVTVEEMPAEPDPAPPVEPPPAEPTLEEVIDYINALTEATPSEPEQEAEPETSVTVEELPPEEYSGDGRPSSGMPFLSGLAQEMAMMALLGSSLNDAGPRGEITIEELLGE